MTGQGGEGPTFGGPPPPVRQPYQIRRRMAYDGTRLFVQTTHRKRQHANTMARITIRIDEDEKQRFKNKCDTEGVTMSEALKEDIRDRIGNTTTGPLPDEMELAKAYRRLWKIRDSNDRIPVSDAEPQLANALNLPSETIRGRIFPTLESRGYITVKVGVVTLNVPLSQPTSDTTEVPADD